MPSDILDDRRRSTTDSPLINISPQPQQHRQQQKERCPRCESRDTKFCYYNNYNTSQPRHFCRSCRRYWTLGGSLRNVPIGGSSRKRLRPNPPSNSNGHVLVAAQLMTDVPPFDPFGFDLGLGLGSMKAGPNLTPTSSMEDIRFGMGPTSLVWGLDTWQVESGGVAGVSSECGGGPANGEVHY